MTTQISSRLSATLALISDEIHGIWFEFFGIFLSCAQHWPPPLSGLSL